MSVINQMLKDLEKRNVSINHREIVQYREKIIIFLLLSLIILFILSKSFFVKKTSHSTGLLENNSLPSFNLNHFLREDITQHVVPTVLTAITLQIQHNMTDLRFLLSQDTLYRINYYSIKNKLIIYLEHSHMIVGLPNIRYLNSAIQHMEIVNQTNGDLKIILTLNLGAEFNYLNLENKKFPELQLHFNYNAPIFTALPEKKIETKKNPPKKIVIKKEVIKKEMLVQTAEEEYYQALNYVAQGEPQKTIALLSKLIEKHPEYRPARDSLAEIQARNLVNAGKIDQALDILQLSPPSLEENPDYHAFIAALYERNGEANTSAKLYEQLLKLDQSKSVWWVGLGMALESLGKHQEAKNSYAKASNLADLTPELKAYISTRLDPI